LYAADRFESSEKINRLEILDIKGKVVYMELNPKNRIDISSIANGIYTIRLNSNNAEFPSLIIQR